MSIAKIIASGLGTGYAPKAPGTVGALLGVIIAYFLNYFLLVIDIDKTLLWSINIILIIILLLVGVWATKEMHKEWSHDASKIVIDEIVGVYIAILFVPFHWKYYLIAFILFRFFDILKPLGIRKLDDLKGSWSVMLDDVLAGVYSLIVLQLMIYFIF